jgi:hypothetical protein
MAFPYKFGGVDIAKTRNADMPNLQNSNLADESGCPETGRSNSMVAPRILQTFEMHNTALSSSSKN